MAASPAELRSDPMIWSHIAPLGAWVILPGLWGAIFSSAVGAMLGAPRTLQAMAIDRLLPGVLSRRTGGRRDLAPGFVVTLAIALGAVLLGDLNAVAPVVTMFFLTVYGTLNVVAAVESLSGDPSWRPKLRVPWLINLVGGLACIAVMFLVSPLAGLLAFLSELLLWLVLSRREGRATWGDARRGLYETLVRWALFRLADLPQTARNWRPHVQVFVPDAVRHLDLIRFASWFSQGRGLVTVTQMIVGDLLDPELDLMGRRKELRELLEREHLPVFSEVDVVSDEFDGLTNVAQAHGMGALENNTILVGWPRRKRRLREFLRILHRLEGLNKSLIIGRIRPRFLYPREGVRRVIHIWWGGLQQNGDLMLLLTYLLTRNHAWRNARVQVMSVASNDLTKTETESYLAGLISAIRIDAEIHVTLLNEGKSVREIIHSESADAEVVFFGLASPKRGEEASYADRIEELAGDLPCVFFVKNSSCFIGELLQRPEEEAEAQMEAQEPEEEPAEQEEGEPVAQAAEPTQEGSGPASAPKPTREKRQQGEEKP
jgi:hypothetical protein